MNIPRSDIYGYLGYRAARPDAAVRDKVESALSALTAAVTPRVLWRRFPLTFTPPGIRLGDLPLHSADLAAHLAGCGSAILLAATLGAEADRLLRRAGTVSTADAVVLQACAAAHVEAVCDEAERDIDAALAAERVRRRPRYSPGYGDLALTLQRPLLRLLDAEKRLGLTVTAADMLSPTKSVTAIIGIYQEETHHER